MVKQDSLPNGVSNLFQFNKEFIDTTYDIVCAYKLNLAFYEALGLDGFKLLDNTVKYIKEISSEIIVIGDGKRGDISTTAELYVSSMFDIWNFDAVTINPLMGIDTIRPWLVNPEKRYIYLLSYI